MFMSPTPSSMSLLSDPLLSTTRKEGKSKYKDESSNTVHSSEYDRFASASVSGDEEAGANRELPTKIEKSLAYFSWFFSKVEWICASLYYVAYFAIAVIISLYNYDEDKEHGRAYWVSSLVVMAVWWLASVVPHMYFFFGSRLYFRWVGLTPVVISSALNTATFVFFVFSFGGHSGATGTNEGDWLERNLHNYLIIFMAVTLWFDTKIFMPKLHQLHYATLGAINSDEISNTTGKTDTSISNVDAKTLHKIVIIAIKAVGISHEEADHIKEELRGLRIGDSSIAGDDLKLIIYSLSHAVSFLAAKDRITSVQYRNLVRQMIIYLKTYMDTGKVSDERPTSTVPMTFGGVISSMFKLCMQVPFQFFLALLPRTIQLVVQISVVAKASGEFVGGIVEGWTAIGQGMDPSAPGQKAARWFWILMAVYACNPIFSFLANIVESRFGTALVDCCRRRMLAVMLRGGTKFSEAHRQGKLVDAFSNQLTQLELFTTQFFIVLLPTFIGVFSGVILSASSVPFAAILFLSLIPVMISMDYFTLRSMRASFKKSLVDGLFMGKIASVVECRDAVRVCNASDWVEKDLSPLLTQTRIAHRTGFFRSKLVENSTEVLSAIYMVLIIAPLGVKVYQFKLSLQVYIELTAALTAMIAAITLIGMAQTAVTLYSGSLQTTISLMDDRFVEYELPKAEPGVLGKVLKKKKERTDTPVGVEMSALSNALTLSGVTFRYGPKLPDVLKSFSCSIGKGEYMVLCGGSGSGKSTVLNLLMRFREPNEGSIKWDDVNLVDTSLASFRDNVSVMFQKTMIYQASIRENIMFGMPFTPGGVERAAQSAEIDDAIKQLPFGYETVIGGDAIAGMSGGQLQRICLARALYRNPSVLLLDEATSALDAKTENEIIETLVKLRDEENLTMVSVSHHPSTAVKADSIVVLDQGVVAEEGSYKELVSQEGGIFKGLVEAGEKEKSV